MVTLSGMTLPIIDIIALLVLLLSWQGYAWVVDRSIGRNTESLVNVVHPYRRLWIKNMIMREERLLDIRIIGNLLKTTTFFASTSLFIVAGLFGVLGYGKEVTSLLKDIPFFAGTELHMWAIKTIVLIVIFIVSFFKYTWVIRQFNYASVLIAAAPYASKITKKEQLWVDQISTILSNSARHFNASVRSYYFGLATLSWYLSPKLLIVSCIIVVWMIYRREFRSRTLSILSEK
jgi:uncharacterized membrane protein